MSQPGGNLEDTFQTRHLGVLIIETMLYIVYQERLYLRPMKLEGMAE